MTTIKIIYYSEDFRSIMLEKLNKIIDEMGKQKISPKVVIEFE